MPYVDSLDWTDLNSLRRYPLRDGCSALSTDSFFTLPDNFIVDFSLSASSSVEQRYYISRFFNKVTSVIIEISDFSGVVVGVVEITKSTHSLDSDYYLTATASYVGANGKITIGTFDDLATQPIGDFTFNTSATEFEPRTIIPSLRGIDRLVFIDSTSGYQSMTGDVTLVSRTNERFSYSDNLVYFDAGDGLGLNIDCTLKGCVKSINGVAPDPTTGNISLLGINCIRVYSSEQYTVDLEDTCCTPCSGCDDLEQLTARLTSLENKFLDLKGNYNNVNAQLTTYLATINSNCACPT